MQQILNYHLNTQNCIEFVRMQYIYAKKYLHLQNNFELFRLTN